jgi:hypothetical protein
MTTQNAGIKAMDFLAEGSFMKRYGKNANNKGTVIANGITG